MHPMRVGPRLVRPGGLPLARAGTTVTFALAGLVSAVSAVRLPALADKLSLDAAELGFALLFTGIGATIATQAGRVVIGRLGSRRVLMVACPATAALSAGSGLAPSYPLLVVAFLVYGMAFGLLDGSMNAQASTLERIAGRHLMNGAHAGWSIGAVSGGGLGALTAWAGYSYAQATVGTAVVTLPVALLLTVTYLPDGPTGRTSGGSSAVPKVIFLVGAVTFASFLIEGSVSNWSSLYLRDEVGAVQAIAAFGYPSMELAMIVGRTVGDRVRVAVGSRAMLTLSGLVACAGLCLVVASRSWPVAVCGFFIVGLAVSTVVPLTFSIAGSLVPSGAGVAQVAAMGYAGMLLGPVVLGVIADASSLRVTFVVVAALAVLMSVVGRVLPTGQEAGASG
jgi:MFS family permease